MAFENLQELYKQRRWYHAAEEIKRIVAQDKLSQAENDELVGITRNLFPRMHPITISETVVLITNLQEPRVAIGLLSDALKAIQAQSREETSYINECLALKMEMALCYIKLGDLEDREANIFEWRNQRDSEVTRNWHFTRENCNLLNKVGYSYYSSTGNIELAQEYLLEYIKGTGDDREIERLIELSLISKSFFDFISITSLEGFEKIKEKKIGKLFIDFQQGVFSEVEKWEGDLREIVLRLAGEDRLVEYMMHVTDKIYLINMVSICFNAPHKYVHLETFKTELKVTNEEVVQLLLRLLGHGLLTGWLDTEKGVLMFDKVMPKSLSIEDISGMKNKFIVWKERVQRAIDELSQ